MKAGRAGGLAAFGLLLHLLAACASAPPPRPVLPPVQNVAAAIGPQWPRREVLDLARRAYRCGLQEGAIYRNILTVIDYSLPSSERRLWVIDMLRNEILHHELVAHGEGSGGRRAVAFSNEIGSHQSSLGLFRADEVYNGRFGYSLRLSGLEPAINDKARERAIVIHGSSDVSDSFAERWGRVGNSFGCPAVPVHVANSLIDKIANGSAIFAYYPDQQWLSQSRFLNCPRGPY